MYALGNLPRDEAKTFWRPSRMPPVVCRALMMFMKYVTENIFLIEEVMHWLME